MKPIVRTVGLSTDPVTAPKTLGVGVEVEKWFLASYFLRTWRNWSGLKSRYERYFGIGPESLSRAWQALDRRCLNIANELTHNSDIVKQIRENWKDADLPLEHSSNELRLGQTWYSAIVGTFKWLQSFDDFEIEQGSSDNNNDVYHLPHSEIGLELRSLWSRFDATIGEQWSNRPDGAKRETRNCIRNYCRANLIVRWLVDPEGLRRNRQLPALYSIHFQEKSMAIQIDEFLSQILDSETKGIAKRVVDRIGGAIYERGFEDFVEDVTSEDFQPGPDSPVGSNQINVIPSSSNGSCKSVLLAISRGQKKGGLGFPTTMQQVCAHLARCSETKAVMIVCDHWKPDMLDDYHLVLKEHHVKGVRFQFLLVGYPNTMLTALNVNLMA